MRGRRWMVVMAVVLAASLACAAGQSAYDGIDVEQLADSLGKLRMYELLDQLARQPEGSGNIRSITAEAKIARALTLQGSARDRLLDEAVVQLRKVVADSSGAGKPKDLIKRYRLMLKLAMTSGITRSQPYADALLFLRGGQADRKALAAATEEPARLITQLTAEMGQSYMAWRTDWTIWMEFGPILTQLQNKTKYFGSMIRLYRGMSVDGADERMKNLRGAVEDASGFVADGQDASPIMYWSLLLIGRAERELGDHDRAAARFDKAMSAAAPGSVRTQAAFEAVRNVIEYGRTLARQAAMLAAAGQNSEARVKALASEAKFSEAATAVDAFRTASVEGRDEAGVRYVDLMTSLLRSYLFETRSALQKDADKARAYSARAQGALMDFVNRYPDPTVQQAFYSLIYGKYRGRTDYEKLNSVALMAIGMHEYDIGQRQGGAGGGKALDRSERVLRIICKRAESGADKAVVKVHPQALWRLAMIMNVRRDNLQAGKLFVELVRTYPRNPLAREAGEFAVRSLFGVYQERSRNKQDISPETRAAYIQALESYVGNPEWAKNPKVAQWNFQLAEQYEWMANAATGKAAATWAIKAADAYEKVPANLPEAMQARGRALRNRARVLTSSGRQGSDRAAVAGRLVAGLLSYSADARVRLRGIKDRDKRADLLQWGSEAELIAAELMFDIINDPTRAMKLLESLPEKWPGADVLKRSESLKIRKLVEQGRISDAVAALDLFRRKNPKEAEGLLPLLIDKVQDKIRNLRGDDLRITELKQYQQNYFNLTRELFERVKDEPLSERYVITQTYADALLEVGKADEALKVLLLCKAYDETKRKVKMKEIDELYGPKITAVRQAAGDIEALERELDKFRALLRANAIQPRRDDITGTLANVEEAWNYYKRAKKAAKAERLKRQMEFAKSLQKGIARIAIVLKKRVPLEASNVLGLARAYNGVGLARKRQNQPAAAGKAFSQAMEHYNRLLGGLDPRNKKHQRLFWQAQLGYCESVLEALGDKKEAMKNLLGRIRLLRSQSQAMGGYYPRFNKIEADAKRLSQ